MTSTDWPRAPTSWPTASALSATRSPSSCPASAASSTLSQSIQNQFGGDTTFGQMGDADRLIGGMRSLGDTLQATFGNMANNLEWVDPVVIALDGSPYCDSNPVCSTARDQFRQLQTARNDGTLEKLADQLQSTGPLSNLSQTVTKLTQSMNSLTGSMGVIGAGQVLAAASRRWAICKKASISLADGGRQVADGVQQLVDQTKRMGTGPRRRVGVSAGNEE